MVMLKLLLKYLRGTVGIWSQLRRLTTLIEWNLVQGLEIETNHDYTRFRITGSLPPSTKDVEDSIKDKIEVVPELSEEERAAMAAVEILRKRSKGEKLDDHDPGKDWRLV